MTKADKKNRARTQLREFFLKNVGRVVDTKTLREVAGISEYARRIRELRNDEGYRILTHHDRVGLKPGQYILEDPHPRPVLAGGIDAQKRARILARNGYTCQACGLGAGDPDPLDPERRVRLHIDHVIPKKEGGTDDDSNLRVLCSVCNEGRSNLEIPPAQQAINVMGLIRRAPRDIQLQVLEFLTRKFKA